ncbi:hypothetical protein BDC45DRAFT_530769 [Circinella umbellata]|nr:hypothetical protein BDC45DRAFT_530769 [Circinella umbellata]
MEPVSTTLLQPPVPPIEGRLSTGSSGAPLEFDFERAIPERMAEKASLQIKRIVDRGGISIASHNDILNAINSTIISYFDSGMYEVESYIGLFECMSLNACICMQSTNSFFLRIVLISSQTKYIRFLRNNMIVVSMDAKCTIMTILRLSAFHANSHDTIKNINLD